MSHNSVIISSSILAKLRKIMNEILFLSPSFPIEYFFFFFPLNLLPTVSIDVHRAVIS